MSFFLESEASGKKKKKLNLNKEKYLFFKKLTKNHCQVRLNGIKNSKLSEDMKKNSTMLRLTT